VLLDGLVHAIRTLTVIPVPGPEGAGSKERALPWFVVVGIVLGGCQFFTGWLFGLDSMSNIRIFAGLFIVIFNYGISGGLHLDGLADFADAFGTRHDKDKTLAILKDPHAGTFGVAAVTVAILWRTIVYHLLLVQHQFWIVVFGIGISRLVQAILVGFLPYARGQEGKAHGYRASGIIRIVIIAELTICLSALWNYTTAAVTLVAITSSFLVVVWIIWAAVKRIGGITGDCIGAASEGFELVFFTTVIVCQG
jgi:adenosylcobinamide-GDP ribazoletransferase